MVLGIMRAKVDSVQACFFIAEQREKPLVHALKFSRADESAPNARLIGGDHYFKPGALQTPEPRGCARDKLHPLRIGEIVPLFDQGSIPIKKNEHISRTKRPTL